VSRVLGVFGRLERLLRVKAVKRHEDCEKLDSGYRRFFDNRCQLEGQVCGSQAPSRREGVQVQRQEAWEVWAHRGPGLEGSDSKNGQVAPISTIRKVPERIRYDQKENDCAICCPCIEELRLDVIRDGDALVALYVWPKSVICEALHWVQNDVPHCRQAYKVMARHFSLLGGGLP